MHDRSTVLVTGATGAVGPALVNRLLEEDLRVRVLSRGVLPLPWPEGSVEVQWGDVTDRDAVARAVDGVAWVFHLAALLHVTRASPELVGAYERVNVDGTRLVAEESARAGVARLVFFSTIGVYGPTGPEGADEDSRPRPDSLYAETKLRAEEAVRRTGEGGRPSTSVLRLAAVYGPRVKGNYARLARALDSGWFVPIGQGRNRRTLVHEADVAEAALLVARRAEAAGRTYNVSDGDIHPLRDVIGAICHARERRSPRLSVPTRVAAVAATIGDAALSAFGRARRLGPVLEKYTEDVAVRAERIQHELGFHARFDLEAGWRDALCRRGAP